MTTTEAHGSLKLRAGDRVAIVAGSGRLPIDLAEKLAAGGYPPFIVMVNGEADEGLTSYEHQKVELESFADLAPLLKRNGATHAVFAGGISRRP